MRITNAAMSFISIPSPKGNPFREGPTKEKRKLRSLSRVLSAPIRRIGKELSKRSSRNSPRNGKPKRNSKNLQTRDEEQGWIAPAATFETEDTLSPRSYTLSPRSFDSLTTSDSTSFLVQTEERDQEEILTCSIIDSSQQIFPDLFLDLEAGVNVSAETSIIFRRENDVQDDTHDMEYNENIPENYEKQNAAPQIETNIQEDMIDNNEVFRELTSLINDDAMVSLLSRIDTTEIIDEADEIDSLVPAADISFFLEEEDDDNFHCVGRISTHYDEAPPVEIDVESIDDLSKNSHSKDDDQEDVDQELYIEDDDESSYNSYLEAIESITASANSGVELAMTMAMYSTDVKTPSTPPPEVKFEQEPEMQYESEFDEDDYYCISFNPSRELLLQAMEGASAKAKADIERATALALSKMNSASSASTKKETLNKARATSKSAPNRVLGFLFFLLLLFNLNNDSYRFFRGIRSVSHLIGIDDFQIQAQIQAQSDIFSEPNSDRSMWGKKQIIERTNKTQVALKNKNVYNVGCAVKIGCLALGNI
jgi:hypothetical protein